MICTGKVVALASECGEAKEDVSRCEATRAQAKAELRRALAHVAAVEHREERWQERNLLAAPVSRKALIAPGFANYLKGPGGVSSASRLAGKPEMVGWQNGSR